MAISEDIKVYFDNTFNEYLDIMIVTAKLLNYNLSYSSSGNCNFSFFMKKRNSNIELLIPYIDKNEEFDVYLFHNNKQLMGRRLGQQNFKDILAETLAIL